MRLGLVLSFILSLMLLKRFVYKRMSLLTILQLTCVLIVLMIAVDYGSAKQGTVEFYMDAHDEEVRHEKLKFLSGLMDKEDEDKKESFAQSKKECDCPSTGSQVCGEDNKEYLNSCVAQCNGVKVKSFGPCAAKATDAAANYEDMDGLRISAHTPLRFYFTVFDPRSYPAVGSKAWFDLAKHANNLECTFARIPNILNFNVQNGLYLGDNAVMGPLSSDLGINSGAFTVFMLVRIQDLVPDNTPIDILRLYGNSQDNNALTIRLSEVSRSNVIQTAKLCIKVGGSPNWFYAKINENLNIPFDSQVVYMFAVVCQHSNIEVFMSTSLDIHMKSVMKYEISSTVAMSNKPMELNPSKNFNAYIKAFGGYDAALLPGELDVISEHMFMQEKKQDKAYMEEKTKAANMEMKMKALAECPYDTGTCAKCDSIKDWSTPKALMDASTECLAEIDRFCSKNPTHDLCNCWNNKHKDFASKKCENFRRYVKNADYYDIKALDAAALDTIKRTYKLEAQTPAPTPTPTPMVTTHPPTTHPPTPPPTTTRAPSTTPAGAPTNAMDSMMLAAARGDNMGDDFMLKMMMDKMAKKPPADTQVKPAIPPPFLEEEPPRGFWGWIKSLIVPDIPDSVPEWPTPGV